MSSLPALTPIATPGWPPADASAMARACASSIAAMRVFAACSATWAASKASFTDSGRLAGEEAVDRQVRLAGARGDQRSRIRSCCACFSSSRPSARPRSVYCWAVICRRPATVSMSAAATGAGGSGSRARRQRAPARRE
jgi:hypothetical protein